MMHQPIILSSRTNTPAFFCVELTQFFHVRVCVCVCACLCVCGANVLEDQGGGEAPRMLPLILEEGRRALGLLEK